jgi:hypothetical protein
MLFILQMLVLGSLVFAQTASDYLILQDIAHYKLTKGLLFRGKIVGAEPKVSRVGNDVYGYYTSYETSYAGDEGYSAPTVEVRVYDFTQWLLHEVDAEFRNYYGIPGLSYTIKNIDGYMIFVYSSGGRDYRWLSGTNVVVVDYTDLMMEKSEPLEIVRAYLAKHPSTLPAMTLAQLRSPENKTKWIKAEMERRLWLCDKWFEQLQLGKEDQSKVLQESVKSMKVFLDYRDKYYGVTAKDEKNLLWQYLEANNGTGIQAKLTEYKTWWSAHKANPINVQ